MTEQAVYAVWDRDGGVANGMRTRIEGKGLFWFEIPTSDFLQSKSINYVLDQARSWKETLQVKPLCNCS
jgi:hypothetical protein